MPTIPTALGAMVPPEKISAGMTPVILQVQTDGYVVLHSPEELKQWQEDLKMYHGITMDASGLAGIAAECCCGGRSDKCDMAA